MKVIYLDEWRQWLAVAEREAIEIDTDWLEFMTLKEDDPDEAWWMELARQILFPPLYCVKTAQ